MTEKCSKYESLFIFGSEEDLQKHLESCPDCRREYEESKAVSVLVKEVKPFIKRKTFNIRHLTSIAAGIVVLFLSFWVFQMNYSGINNYKNPDPSAVQQDDSMLMAGLPTDEYGLLSID